MEQELQYIHSVRTSIFLADDIYYDQFEQHCLEHPEVLALLPSTVTENIHLLNCIRDIYFALVIPGEMVSHPNLSMIYVIRIALVMESIHSSRFHTLRLLCQREPQITLLAAVLFFLHIIQLLKTIVADVQDTQFQQSLQFINQFSTSDILYIYDQEYLKQHVYPKELAKAQANVAQHLRNALQQQQDTTHAMTQEVISFIQQHITLTK